jgi:hypothetical protein
MPEQIRRSAFKPLPITTLHQSNTKNLCQALALGLGFLTVASKYAHAEAKISGYVELSGASSTAPSTWNGARGVGVLGTGDGAAGEARVAFDFSGDSRFSAHLGGLVRASSARDQGRKAGLLDAYFDYGDLVDDGFRIRTGFAFAGSSFENVEAHWQTPYTLSLSALNSWIGEEFRPLGITASKRFDTEALGSVDLSASVYGGNDSSAALLAWRGFAVHNRLSVLGETLPLLNLPSLQAPSPSGFAGQRDDGSKPFGADLDQRPGFALRARSSLNNGAHINVFFTDNRGDRELHSGEYAWHTRFGLLGFDFPLSDSTTLVGEVLHGRTNMGFPPGANVAFDFNAAYLLASHALDAWTLSARVESFHINELDRSAGEQNTQNGNGITFAALRNMGDWRVGVEAQYFDITRPGNSTFLATPNQGGTLVRILARRYF